MGGVGKQWVWVAAALAVGSGAGWAGHAYLNQPSQMETAPDLVIDPPSVATLTTREPDPAPTPPVTIAAQNFIAAAVERVGPAVVRIDAERTVSEFSPDTFNNPSFDDFLATMRRRRPCPIA